LKGKGRRPLRKLVEGRKPSFLLDQEDGRNLKAPRGVDERGRLSGKHGGEGAIFFSSARGEPLRKRSPEVPAMRSKGRAPRTEESTP